MAELPPACDPALADRLSAAMDQEGKIPRALEALGPVVGRAVGLVCGPGTAWPERLAAAGIVPAVRVEPVDGEPLRIDAPEGGLDALVVLWCGFRGVSEADLAEADRVLGPAGRLLVVHDYGRDDVSALRDPEAPEFSSWSRRDGPFLREGAFKIRVVHCFWTFEDEAALRETLSAFGERGDAVAAGLKRPRLAWNVAVYHRGRQGTGRPA